MNYNSVKILELIEESGLKNRATRRLLAPLGIAFESLADVDHAFTLAEILAIFRAVIARTDDPEAAFRAGRRFHLTQLGVLGFAVMSQPTLGAALRFALKYRPLASPIIGLAMHDGEGEEHRLVFHPLPGLREDDPAYPRLLDFNLGMFSALIEEGVGRGDLCEEVKLSSRSDYISRKVLEKNRFRVAPEEKEDAFVFTTGALETPMLQKSRIGAAVAQKLCAEAMPDMADLPPVSSTVRAHLIASIDKPVTAAMIAGLMDVSERSLRRQLAAENSNFRELKQMVQDDLARRYLRETRMKVEDIAYATGFSDTANFRRCFRRINGVTPQEFRRMPG